MGNQTVGKTVVSVILGLLVTGSSFALEMPKHKRVHGAQEASAPAASQPEETQESGAITSVSEAENVIRDTAREARKLVLGGKKYDIEDIRLSSDQLDLIYRDGKNVKTYSCALNAIQVRTGRPGFRGLEAVDLGPSCDVQLKPYYTTVPDFLNAIAFLQDEAAFQKVIADYRSQAVKPEIPEETHGYSVQAEFAMDQKQYNRASDLYGKGLKISPWWAQGHFNRALMLAETKQYGLAITEMKRYLTLEPESPNARGAQDKIYQWKEQARSSIQAGQETASR